jgi:AcrR family transcriptional regulator
VSHSAASDPRAQRSRQTVLAAAFELLEESGVAGFSVDEVARRSGVAKTTIYRHWPTRAALVLDACARISAEQEIPDTGTLGGDLHVHLTTVADLLQTANWSAVLPSIVDAAERDAEFATLHAEIQRGHAAPVHEIIRRAIARGELPTGTDPATAAAALLGPLFYRRWFSREPLDGAFIDSVLQRAIAPG